MAWGESCMNIIQSPDSQTFSIYPMCLVPFFDCLSRFEAETGVFLESPSTTSLSIISSGPLPESQPSFPLKEGLFSCI